MKNYKNWCDLKYKINKSERFLSFYAKEIWWCSLGLNIGYEQDGKNKKYERPVLVLKKFNQDILLVLPLTSNNKKSRYYYQLGYKGRSYSVILSQIRLISSKRLLRRIRKISKGEFIKIKKKFNKLF
jgi:mRNA interferase MazF